jgi:hypothetical protein
MNARVVAIMSANHGLITRRQAVSAGMSAEQIDRLVRRAVWTIIRRGVYAETSYVESLRSIRSQRRLWDRAASMRLREPHALSHDSAAYVLGMPILHARPPVTHVTRPGVVGSHIRHGVKHHLAPYAAWQLTEVDGLRCLDLARTAADIAREHGYRPGLVAADSALRMGVSLADLQGAATAMRHWPYKTVVDDVVASAALDTDSVGETLTRELVTELGFGVPEVQFGLTADGRTAWCDLRLGRHVFESDGHLKYQRVDEGGFAVDPGDAVWFEKQRQDWVCGFKLGMSRVVWADHFGAARERAKERLAREYLDTCRRFGTDISDLAQYRARAPRPRPRWNS